MSRIKKKYSSKYSLYFMKSCWPPIMSIGSLFWLVRNALQLFLSEKRGNVGQIHEHFLSDG